MLVHLKETMYHKILQCELIQMHCCTVLLLSLAWNSQLLFPLSQHTLCCWLLTSPPVHTATTCPLYNKYPSVQPCCFVFNPNNYPHSSMCFACSHKTPCHRPTSDWFTGPSRLPQQLGFHYDLRVDISKNRHTVYWLNPEIQWAAALHTLPAPQKAWKVSVINFYLKIPVH